MPVTRLVRPTKKAVVKKATHAASTDALPALPTGPKEAVLDPLQYVLLLYGREKIGKTTWLSTFPEALFLTTEPGTKGLRIHEYNHDKGGCKTWELMLSAVGLLEANPDRYRMVVIDTADRAYDLCLDYICRKLGIDHPGESADGKQDFGKSWKAVRLEFMGLIHRILQTGRGLAFTSHAKEEEFKSRSGEKFNRIHPSMSGQARQTIEALVDLFFYCEYMRAPDGSTRRVIVTEGDEIVWAGHRRIENEEGESISLPRLIPMTEQGGFDIFRAAFRGKDVGLDPATLLPSKSAGEAVRNFFRNIRMVGAQPKLAAPKKAVRRVT